MKLKRINIDQFYTTSYSGEIRKKYDAILRNPCCNRDVRVSLSYAPPKVTRFRQGERVCLVVHSFPGQRYRYQLEGVDPYPRDVWVSGMGKSEILGTDQYFSLFNVGGLTGGWQATCVQYRGGRLTGAGWRRYHETPSRWLWVDQLKPGEYTVRLRIKEPRIKRTYTRETSFSVE